MADVNGDSGLWALTKASRTKCNVDDTHKKSADDGWKKPERDKISNLQPLIIKKKCVDQKWNYTTILP